MTYRYKKNGTKSQNLLKESAVEIVGRKTKNKTQ